MFLQPLMRRRGSDRSDRSNRSHRSHRSHRSNQSIGASFVIHAVVLIALIGYAHRRPVRISSTAGTVAGTRVELVYLPGRAPTPALARKAVVKPTEVTELRPSAVEPLTPPQPQALHLPPRPHLTVSPTAAPPNPASPPAASSDATTGSDSFGAGAIEIAFTTYSPSPAPDLSLLPHGAQGDVVVDVTIDPTGKVGDLQVLHTLGYGVEESVLETVRTWIFRPATKDGVPVASVQELHFHFGPV
jgi:periplasmic protein TonB